MFRTFLGLGSVAVLVAAAGCNMCCHPYDRSGPVYSEDGCQSSGRAGSILDGNSQPSHDSLDNSQIQEESISAAPAKKKTQAHLASFEPTKSRSQHRVPAHLQAKPQPGDVPGSERNVSVTDRLAKPAAESSQLAENSPAEPDKPLPAAGWTARRPTTEVLR